MKKITLLIVLLASLFVAGNAQEEKPETIQKFMQITTLESVVGGGLGRSKMLITKEDGSQEERDMENLFSLTGINMKNIKNNESDILRVIKTYTDQGWKLVQTIPLTLSPNQNGNGIFMTRYLFSKTEEKKGF
jgi:hypothetical protein